jgi:argininosuccinate synthase
VQGVGETDGLHAKAIASGASALEILDLREEFVKDYIFPCLRAGAVYERKYLLGTSMARPIIAKVMLCIRSELQDLFSRRVLSSPFEIYILQFNSFE